MRSATPHNEMLAALLAQEIRVQLELHDSGDGAGSWFASASRSLSEKDFDKFVAACRKRLAGLNKEADGCPSRIFSWPEHFSAKFRIKP